MTVKKKIDNYDEFRCIAGSCPNTCCRGWDISVDEDTYHRWNRTNDFEGTKQIEQRENTKEQYFIHMGTNKSCPFFNEEGLCQVVIGYSDEMIPKTCQLFPRQIVELSGTTEYSLSCCCPEVVRQLNERQEKLKILTVKEPELETKSELAKSKPDIKSKTESESKLKSEPESKLEIEYTKHTIIRNWMMKEMQNRAYSIEERLFLLLYTVMESVQKHQTSDDFKPKDEVSSVIIREYRGMDKNLLDTETEIHELFLDVSEYYREEVQYKDFFLSLEQDSAKLEEAFEYKRFEQQEKTTFEAFLSEWKKYENLLEHVLVSKLFANCTMEDTEEISRELLMILLEYLMIRHTMYLRFRTSRELSYEHLQESIVLYSRMMEYNRAGMQEFLEESFDGEMPPLGYLVLVL